jgi:hypothetical protein
MNHLSHDLLPPPQGVGDHVVYVAMGTLAQLSEQQVGHTVLDNPLHVLH